MLLYQLCLTTVIHIVLFFPVFSSFHNVVKQILYMNLLVRVGGWVWNVPGNTDAKL